MITFRPGEYGLDVSMTNLDIDQIRNKMLSLKYETAKRNNKTAGYAGDRSDQVLSKEN